MKVLKRIGEITHHPQPVIMSCDMLMLWIVLFTIPTGMLNATIVYLSFGCITFVVMTKVLIGTCRTNGWRAWIIASAFCIVLWWWVLGIRVISTPEPNLGSYRGGG